MANDLIFRRPYADPGTGSAPLIFNEVGGGLGELAAVIELGGLGGAEWGLGALAGQVELGGFEGSNLGMGALAAIVEVGGMYGVHPEGIGALAGIATPSAEGVPGFDLDVPSGPGVAWSAPNRPAATAAAGVALVRSGPRRIGAAPVARIQPGDKAGSANRVSLPRGAVCAGRLAPMMGRGAPRAMGLVGVYAAGLPRRAGVLRSPPGLSNLIGPWLAAPYAYPPRHSAAGRFPLEAVAVHGAGLAIPTQYAPSRLGLCTRYGPVCRFIRAGSRFRPRRPRRRRPIRGRTI